MSGAPDSFQRFAGRRKGRPLRQGRLAVLLHEEMFIPSDVMNQTVIDPQSFFKDGHEKLWLEIGFGNGEHLAEQAFRHPEIGFIGCEPFVNGVSAAVKEIARQELKNIRIWQDEALAFLARWPAASVDRIFLLFSDPWPKTRQYKRRVIQPESIQLFARLLKPGGELRLATDHHSLAEWMLLHAAADPAFTWAAAATGEWRRPPDDWIETRYQQKAAVQGRPAYFMSFKRK